MESRPAPSSPSPEATNLPSLLLGLAERLEQVGLTPAANILTRAAATHGRKTLRAIVLGRFSVGKSTLINAFLGYPVLPGGLAPTTGVLCRITYGQPGASVRFKDGSVERFAGPEALQPYVALSQADPTAAGRLRSIVRVEVTLPLPLLQNQLEIVDSPGLDEAADRTGESTGALDSADIVLFVLAADQMLGEVERAFLLQEVLPRCPGALALVVNFWDRIAVKDQPAVMERLEAGAREIAEHWRKFTRLGSDPQVPVFPMSANRALRTRWKGHTATGDASGIAALEEWLMATAAGGSEVLDAALEGRVHFAATMALRVVEIEQAKDTADLRAAEHAAADASGSQTRAERALKRAEEICRMAPISLKESLGVRIAEGEGRFSSEIQQRLQRDPFDSLEAVRRGIAAWWPQVQAQVQTEAASSLVEIAGLLQEAGSAPGTDTLQALNLGTSGPALEFTAASDTTAPVKDTISGLLGSVSRSAADSASDWMKRASKAASARIPRNRSATKDVLERLQHSFSLTGFQGRAAVSEWGERLAAVVSRVAEMRLAELRDEAARRERAIRTIRERLTVLASLAADLREMAELQL